MWVLTLQCHEADRDLLIADLYGCRTKGVIEEDLPAGRFELRAFFNQRFDAGPFKRWSPRWEPADDTNWARRIMEDWAPVAVGERFFLAPEWRNDSTPPGRIRLEVNPGTVLGTGYHPTTQMCLEAMERFLRDGDSFVDLGCGSGILAHAAWLLGERRIVAADIDPDATRQAAERLAASGVPVGIYTGSTRALRNGSAEFLVANLGPLILESLEPEITRCMAAEGRAVLSGFRPPHLDTLTGIYQAAGHHCLWSADREEWGCVVIEKISGRAISR